jgi:hypothetical protein
MAQLQTYLGMVNFYTRFFKSAAAVLHPLTEALRGGQKGDFIWTEEMQSAFARSKLALCQAAELAHPLPGAEISLAVDAPRWRGAAAARAGARDETAWILLCKVRSSAAEVFCI